MPQPPKELTKAGISTASSGSHEPRAFINEKAEVQTGREAARGTIKANPAGKDR